ncbi:hypothetical protein CCR75_000315 [Bremia lactucae]|uniref:MSP domain-containing protein n=1 Tax=Bremia lactucae TaxID=4779 RepID=A0A976FKS4_BRELC|nr:hypothetical protein CCR75_000315 [Bremia lactucae]
MSRVRVMDANFNRYFVGTIRLERIPKTKRSLHNSTSRFKKYSMFTASVGVGSSLLLEPARELLFPFPQRTSSERPRCILTLTNLSHQYDVVFRVRTRNPDAFTVRPTHGLVMPGARVQIILSASIETCERVAVMNSQDLQCLESSELFLVQNVERGQQSWAREKLDFNALASLRRFWQNVPNDCITENKMVCRFIEPRGESLTKTMQNKKVLSSSMNNTNVRYSEKKSLGPSAGEHRYRNKSSTQSLNQFTPPQDQRERSRRQNSVTNGASYYKIMEPPVSENQCEENTETWTKARPSLLYKNRISTSGLSSTIDDNSFNSNTVSKARPCDVMSNALTDRRGSLLYSITPSEVLPFHLKRATRYWGSTELCILNSSQSNCLIFKVRTSNQSGYVVQPSRGIVSIACIQKVVVTLCAPPDAIPSDVVKREATDGFLIEVAAVSRDIYDDFMKLEKPERIKKLASLWSLIPSSTRETTVLAVNLHIDKSKSDRGTSKSFENGNTISQGSRRHSYKSKNDLSPSFHQRMKGLFLSSSVPKTRESEDKLYSKHACSDPHNTEFTIPPIVASAVEGDSIHEHEAAHSVRHGDNAVIVVSADRIDTIDFTNPKLSFFI